MILEVKGKVMSSAMELNLAEQRERKRLAGELHDYLAQLLVLCRLNLGQIRRAGLAPKGEEMVKETEEVLNQALNYSRTLMAELSQPGLMGEHAFCTMSFPSRSRQLRRPLLALLT
jgi:signal transduction histidine kinase